MTVKSDILIIGVACLTPFATLAATQPRAATAEEAIERRTEMSVFDRPWVTYRTAPCSPAQDGPGATREVPINAKFRDLSSSARLWGDPEMLTRTKAWAEQSGEELDADLDCRWVKVSGYFRRSEYQGYRGTLDEDSQSFYLSGGPNLGPRDSAYFIESWADPATQSALINGAQIEVVGQHYDLCRAAKDEQKTKGEEWFILGGPCHYGDLTGLMIRDAVVTKVLSKPFQRLKGEVNRPVVGSIREIPKSWPEYAFAKSAAIDWIAAVRKGPRHYWTERLSGRVFDEPALSQEIERRAADSGDWIFFLANHPESPLLSHRRIERNEFKAFRLMRLGGRETEQQINIAITCFCTEKSCGDEWPLFHTDAESFHDKYVCVTLRRDHDAESKWTW